MWVYIFFEQGNFILPITFEKLLQLAFYVYFTVSVNKLLMVVLLAEAPERPHHAAVPLVPLEECQALYSHLLLTPDMLCAAPPEGGRDACMVSTYTAISLLFWSLIETDKVPTETKRLLPRFAVSIVRMHVNGWHESTKTCDITKTKQSTKTVGMLYAWASCQIRKIADCACAGNAGNVFPATTG